MKSWPPCCARAMQPILVFVRNFLQLTVVLAVLMGVFGSLEKLWGLRRQKLFRKAFATDLVYYFLSGILPRLLLILPLSLLARLAHHFFAGSLYQWTAALPLVVRVILAAAVGDIGSYWGHRWSHEIPWLWRFHSVHHSAEEMDWLINTRAHPVDLIFTRLCGYVPMYVLGLAQPMAGAQLDAVPVIVIVLGAFWGYFIHANLRWRFGWLEYLVSTPHFHHWHHTSSQASINKNYSALLPGVDALFGTLYLPDKSWPEQYGTQEPVPETLAAQLLVLK
jgi:sterol desaturase/sphingolipid hydroxylase (fatty acid hydroxylase superfamily)